ncbi:hypothetical protein KIMH_11980 [Bombiscardovia apis]|uniref:DUF4097 domain-containing protein n=1 Tax=Bombiscardovia apis TaxID=2932182 RepID=A0ABM8BDW2_9BIFI|nr:DUF4097 family beta strand repeat-containing protein [Bombiscardovia apis]BDR55087.1 hypothetical protein KIMH_11980 [Bombiscardovia apis]
MDEHSTPAEQQEQSQPPSMTVAFDMLDMQLHVNSGESLGLEINNCKRDPNELLDIDAGSNLLAIRQIEPARDMSHPLGSGQKPWQQPTVVVTIPSQQHIDMLVLTTNGGSAQLDAIHADRFMFTAQGASIRATDLVCDALGIDCQAASVEASNVQVRQHSVVTAEGGRVSITIQEGTRTKADFGYQANCVNGSIHLPDRTLTGMSQAQRTGSPSFELTSTNSRITLA